MAIMPHCVACDFPSGAPVEGEVEFADYDPSWTPPQDPYGNPIPGSSNSLGVTAPPGVGLFCAVHLPEAQRLAHLPAAEALKRMEARRPGESGPMRRLRNLFK
jgi:hypothetical protein